MRLFRLLSRLFILLLCIFLWPQSVPEQPPHSTLVVLGAAQYSGRPSPALQVRLDHALELYQAGGISTIVVTGGRLEGDPYSEGGVGINYLQRHGVPAEVLLAEERSRSTEQNLSYALELLPANTPITIVTDRLHAPRALAMAQQMGLVANANPSPLWKNASFGYFLRERLAYWAYTLFGYAGALAQKEKSG